MSKLKIGLYIIIADFFHLINPVFSSDENKKRLSLSHLKLFCSNLTYSFEVFALREIINIQKKKLNSQSEELVKNEYEHDNETLKKEVEVKEYDTKN